MSDGAIIGAVIGAVAVAIVAIVLGYVARSAVRLMNSARKAVDDVHAATMAILADVHTSVRKANVDLNRVDAILDNVEDITGTADSASRLAYSAISAPVVKTMAAVSGLGKAWQWLRRTK